MSIPVTCRSCGALFPFTGIGGTGFFRMQGCATNCPECGKLTLISDGTYEIANSALQSFRGVGAADLLRFQTVLAGAQNKPSVEITKAATEINPAFGKVVRALQALGGLPLLVALLSLYIQYAAYREDKADQDAVLNELRADSARQEEMIEGMRELIAALDRPEPQPHSPQKPSTSHTPPSEASGSDRAARRRAWKQEKRASKDNSIKFRR